MGMEKVILKAVMSGTKIFTHKHLQNVTVFDLKDRFTAWNALKWNSEKLNNSNYSRSPLKHCGRKKIA